SRAVFSVIKPQYLQPAKKTKENRLDGYFKKIKVKFHESTRRIINKLLGKKVSKLSQDFITKVDIDSNRPLLNMSLLEIYEYDKESSYKNMPLILSGLKNE